MIALGKDMGLKSGDCSIWTMVIAVIAAFSTIICLILYIIIFFNSDYELLDRLFSFLLLPAVLFFVVSGLGYSLWIFRSNFLYNKGFKERNFLSAIEPMIAVFITDFNEDRATLERTIYDSTLMNYRNKLIYLLDDSDNNELKTAAQEIAQKYEIKYIHRDNRIGYKAGAINEALKKTKAKYIMLLDADQRPSQNFLDEIVPMLEADQKLAFVQTPQFYVNHETNRVTGAAFFIQASFFNYICEGKCVANAIFTSGTNVVIRVSALQEIGGFDEENLTEDVSTSFKLHKKGYRSYYYNHILVEGKGPLDISGFNKQQMRWAYGDTRLLMNVVRSFLTDRGSLTRVQWQEYFLTGMWYFVGFATFVLTLNAVAVLLIDIHPLPIKNQYSYLFIYLPYFIFSFLPLLTTLKTRRIRINAREILSGLIISFITFPIYMKATFYALVGKNISFIVTPKGNESSSSIKHFLPQIAMMIAMAFSVGMGIIKISHQVSFPLTINTIWCLYCLAMLQGIWYFMSKSRDVNPASLKV